MEQQKAKRNGVGNFVSTMLSNTQQNKETKPYECTSNVDNEEFQKVMSDIKKGIRRR
ncbi:MAG: hypothetical protein AB1668_01415 [Nanoarchaeota archaeon]